MRSTAAYDARSVRVQPSELSPGVIMSKNKGGREVRKPKQPKQPKAATSDSSTIPPTKQGRK
jgi:hypothetical protein